MKVDIKKSNKELVCNWCHKPIREDEFRLLWTRKYKDFTNRYYYHCEPDCWMEERMFYAERRYYAPKSTGRPKLTLSEEERTERRRKQHRESYERTKGGKDEKVHNHSGD